MPDRSEEFEDALSLMDAASRLLSEGDCPFDVAAHLDFAVHRLADHVGTCHPELTGAGRGNGYWLN
jgi:hypothetical protein